MTDSKVVPVRMPNELYQDVIASKPPELKISSYLLLLIRRGLNADVEDLYTKIENSREPINEVLINSLQSRIAELEEQLGAVQRIVEGSQAIRAQALTAIDATIDAAVQKAVDSCSQLVNTRVREVVKDEMGAVLGESRA